MVLPKRLQDSLPGLQRTLWGGGPSGWLETEWFRRLPMVFFLGKKWVSGEETPLNAMKYLEKPVVSLCLLAKRSEFCCSSLCPNNFWEMLPCHRCSYEYQIMSAMPRFASWQALPVPSSGYWCTLVANSGHWKRIKIYIYVYIYVYIYINKIYIYVYIHIGIHWAAKSGYGKSSNPIEFLGGHSLARTEFLEPQMRHQNQECLTSWIAWPPRPQGWLGPAAKSWTSLPPSDAPMADDWVISFWRMFQ